LFCCLGTESCLRGCHMKQYRTEFFFPSPRNSFTTPLLETTIRSFRNLTELLDRMIGQKSYSPPFLWSSPKVCPFLRVIPSHFLRVKLAPKYLQVFQFDHPLSLDENRLGRMAPWNFPPPDAAFCPRPVIFSPPLWTVP